MSQTRGRLDLAGRTFDSLADLQRYTDERLDADGRRRVCPPTGTTIQVAWEAEQTLLHQPDSLPEVIDVCVIRPVHDDCTVNFESRTYSVPLAYVRRLVEVRGCSDVVQFFCDGKLIAQHERRPKNRLVINNIHYETSGDDRVQPPPPLGKLTRRILDIAAADVEVRAAEYYARLMEVVT